VAGELAFGSMARDILCHEASKCLAGSIFYLTDLAPTGKSMKQRQFTATPLRTPLDRLVNNAVI
jgi:hypothetical protein